MDHSNTRLSSQLDRNPGMFVVLLLVLLKVSIVYHSVIMEVTQLA